MPKENLSHLEAYNGGAGDRNDNSHYSEGGRFDFRAIVQKDWEQSARSDLVHELRAGDRVDIQLPESEKKGTAQIYNDNGTPQLQVRIADEKGKIDIQLPDLSKESVARGLDEARTFLDRPRSADASQITEKIQSDRPPGVTNSDDFRSRAELGYLESFPEPKAEIGPDASQDLPPVKSKSLGPERTISSGAIEALKYERAVEYRGNDGTRIDMQLIRGDEPALLWSASEPGQEENPHQIRTPLVVEGDNYRDADGRDLRAVVENFKAGFYPNYNPSEA